MLKTVLLPVVHVQQDNAPSIAANLEYFHAHMLSGNLYAKFKHDNPGEAGRLETYWANSKQWPAVTTQTGLALRAAYQAHHQATGG